MASPFSYFRKHMKAMLALLTVLVMGGFVVLPILMKTMDGGGGARANNVVVSTDRYGSLRESDISFLQRDRAAMQSFLRQVAASVTPDPRYARMTAASRFMRSIGSTDEENVVNTWLLARHAEDQGLIVTDQAVEDFLQQLVEGKLDGEEIETIANGLDISVDNLLRLLRHELLAYHTKSLFQVSMGGSTPAERWDYYKRLNRRIAIEAIEVPVEKFVSEVPAPDDRTLDELFEKHKNEEPNPSSSDPGFRVPTKIEIEYFKADYELLVEQTQISESEIRQFYEEHKAELFKREKLPSLDSETDPGKTRSTSVPALDEGVESLPGLWKGGKYTLPVEPKPNPESVPADQTEKPAPEEMPPAKESPTTEPSGPEIPSADETKPKAAPESSSPDDTSRLQPNSLFRLVSYPQEEAGQPTPQKPEGEQPPAEKTPDETPASAKDTPDDKSMVEVVDSIVGEQSPAEESEYEPLEKVEDQIKRTLAIEKLHEKLTALQGKMSAYRSKRIPYEAGTADEAPEELDFDKLAVENGLTSYKTDLISAVEARNLDIGKSTIDGSLDFRTAAFQAIAELRPNTSQDDEGNYYLFWILKKTEGRVPEFDDDGIREQVENTWKMIQARVPATKEAERLVAMTLNENSEKSLKQIFSDQTVVETEPFSWMTYGAYPMWMAQAPPSVSDIKLKTPEGATKPETGDAIVAPGNRFMRDVSVLDQGQTGVATNQPKTAVYVVRVTDVSPLEESLWQGFLTDDYRRYSMVSFNDQAELYQAWRQAIKASAGFEWSGRQPRRR
jgi:hypothetical protein